MRSLERDRNLRAKMLKSSRAVIRLCGVRHNNLKNFNLDLPVNRLIVITGLSGSGKSSLAFDTLFAEGQRRYIETFSPYARQFFDRMDKPQVDSIEGIPPAIAIEQRNSVRTTRSTVGTMTELCEYMKMLWPHVAQLHCRNCGRPVTKDSAGAVWQKVLERKVESELLLTFELPLTEKLSLEESLGLISKQGYQRLLVNGKMIRLDESVSQWSHSTEKPRSITVIQDRLKPSSANRSRFVEASEQAYHFGKGKLTVWQLTASGNAASPLFFSNRLHCAECDIEYQEPSPALFSFNHPVGACPTCRGFGRIISIDYNLALPDRSRSIAEGVVRPWQTGHGLDSQKDLLRVCRHLEIPTNVPFEKLAKKWQTLVIEGDPAYGTDEDHQWPKVWYGVKGYFRWLESKAYKMHVRVLLSRYRAYTPCPDCNGKRFQPDALLYRARLHPKAAEEVKSDHNEPTLLSLADFYQLPVRDAAMIMKRLAPKHSINHGEPLSLIFNEVHSRLSYLEAVGLGYLTLDRPTRTLSGGETERVNLTTCLGTRLVNTLFVLDEPSVGLHPRDTERLVSILEKLRDSGNTVVVVEHEPRVMKAADQIVDLGPGHGESGGQLVFQGSYPQILKAANSLTGQYLSGRKNVEIAPRRVVPNLQRAQKTLGRYDSVNDPLILNEARVGFSADESKELLRIRNASRHNLKNVSVDIPLGRLVCLTGVSGSGKTTLMREVLLPALTEKLRQLSASKELPSNGRDSREETESLEEATSPTQIEGFESLRKIVLVDQSGLGKTPRSNPAVYIGAFDDIRELFAQSEVARQRGLSSSAFSFNSGQGQCERCHGAGFEKIEMQFLSDVFVRCPACDGKRYRSHILEVRIRPPLNSEAPPRINTRVAKNKSRHAVPALSIADLLDSTVDETIRFLRAFGTSKPAGRAAEALSLLQEVGLGYLKLGQPINTLSGGERQRLKLVRHLAEFTLGQAPGVSSGRPVAYQRQPGSTTSDRTLFLFDEPTTGLHFDDVRVLLNVFQRLVDAGHSVLVIEHNLDVIKTADWVIDLGPDAGDQGGEIVATGTPEDIAANSRSHTGAALKPVLADQAALAAAI